jgi:carboxypeptidase family protein
MGKMRLQAIILALIVSANTVAQDSSGSAQTGALNLSGRMNTAGSARLELQPLSVRLSPEDGKTPDVIAAVRNDGTFTLTELRRTTYRLRLADLPDGWYLRSAVLGDQNILNNGLRLAEADAKKSLEITVSLGAGKVQGVVLEPEYGDPVPNALVKLFPDPPNPHRADLFQTAPTDQDGRFVIKNVVPGRYRVLAIMGKTGGGENNYEDSLMAAGAGTRVVLAEKQTKHLELELFEAHR